MDCLGQRLAMMEVWQFEDVYFCRTFTLLN